MGLLACVTTEQGRGKPNTDTLGSVVVPVPQRPIRGAICILVLYRFAD